MSPLAFSLVWSKKTTENTEFSPVSSVVTCFLPCFHETFDGIFFLVAFTRAILRKSFQHDVRNQPVTSGMDCRLGQHPDKYPFSGATLTLLNYPCKKIAVYIVCFMLVNESISFYRQVPRKPRLSPEMR